MRIPVTQMSNEVLLRQLLDAMPSYVFLVDRDLTILDYTAGCGHGPFCKSCLIRGAVNEAFAGKKSVRRQVCMELCSGRKVKKLHLLLTASPFTYQGHDRVVLILEDLAGITALQRLLPTSTN